MLAPRRASSFAPFAAFGPLAPFALCALFAGALAPLVAGCSTRDDASPLVVTNDAASPALTDGAAPNDAALAEGGAADAARAPVCIEGRRRCVGMDLQVCDGGAWTVLQSCLAGESCDVAVGICRESDAGPDAH